MQKRTIQIDVISSDEDYGTRYAFLTKAMSEAYMKEKAGIKVEVGMLSPRQSVEEYIRGLLSDCAKYAEENGYESVVCVVRKQTYALLVPFFGMDSNVHASDGYVWQFIPEVPRPGYVTYLVGQPNRMMGGCLVWPLQKTQLELFT